MCYFYFYHNIIEPNWRLTIFDVFGRLPSVASALQHMWGIKGEVFFRLTEAAAVSLAGYAVCSSATSRTSPDTRPTGSQCPRCREGSATQPPLRQGWRWLTVRGQIRASARPDLVSALSLLCVKLNGKVNFFFFFGCWRILERLSTTKISFNFQIKVNILETDVEMWWISTGSWVRLSLVG